MKGKAKREEKKKSPPSGPAHPSMAQRSKRNTHILLPHLADTTLHALFAATPQSDALCVFCSILFGRAAWKNPQVICEVFHFHSLVNTKTKYFLGELFELRYHHDIFSGGLSVSLSRALSFPSFRFSSSSCLKLPGFLFFSL